MDKSPDYKKIYEFVCGRFRKTTYFWRGPFDETYFTLRVFETAKELIDKTEEEVKKEQVLVAAILHDIGKTRLDTSKVFDERGFIKDFRKEWGRHPELGVVIAKRYLKEQGYSDDFIAEVSYLIANHDMRGGRMEGRSIELAILQDADLLADLGFAGFIRPFLYCGMFSKQSVSEAIEFLRKEDRTHDGSKLNLNISKAMAKEGMDIQRRLVAEFSEDIKSDLL
jgi:putative nucleotidyltransferase with HDIG domain